MVLGVRNTAIHPSYIPDPEDLYCIDLDGNSDYVDFGDIGTVKMLSFWFSPDTTRTAATPTVRFMHWYNIASSVYFGIHISNATGILTNETLTLMINTQTRVGAINYTFTAGNWYHVFCSWDDSANAWSLYINGVNVGVAASGDGSAQTIQDFDRFKWGRTGTSGNQFDGKMTDCAVWDTGVDTFGVSPTVIAGVLYNGGTPHDPRIASGGYTSTIVAQLTHYWRVNTGSNTVIYDLVGSANGTTVSTPPWSTESPYN